MFVSIMSEQKVATCDETDGELQTEIVTEIKKNIASLRSSIDQIIHDMEYIRATKMEILEKLDNVKNENVDSAQIQVTLVKARKIMRKSEENRRKLELVLRKLNEFKFVHTFANFTDALGPVYDFSNCRKSDKETQIVGLPGPGQEKIKLRLLENNKYSLATAENKEEKEKLKSNLKWGTDSALRELQWLVKMKLYKLRHRYDKLPFEQEVEERTPLPVKLRRVSGERA